MLEDKSFIDTNLLIYLFGTQDLPKKQMSELLLQKLVSSESGVVSYQVVQEFLNNAQSKLGLSQERCYYFLNKSMPQFELVVPDLNFFNQGLLVCNKYGYSWYDSLIITAALKAECSVLYSEDLHHGQVIEGMRIVNPFV